MIKKKKDKKGGAAVVAEQELPKQEGVKQLIKPKFSKKFYTIIGIFLGIPMLYIGASFAYTKIYTQRVFPGIYIAETYIGRLTARELDDLAIKTNSQLEKGLEIQIVNTNQENSLVTVSTMNEKTTNPIIRIDQKLFISELANDKNNYFITGKFLYQPWMYLVSPQKFSAPLLVDDQVLKQNIQQAVARFEEPPQNARIIVNSISPLNYTITPERNGKIFNYEKIISELKNKVRRLDFSPLSVTTQPTIADLTKEEVAGVASQLAEVFKVGILDLRYTDDQSHFHKEWKIKPENFISWVEAVRDQDNRVILGLNQDKVSSFLEENISPFVKVDSEDAVFSMDGDKVVEFKASKTGRDIDFAKTYRSMNDVFISRVTSGGILATGTIAVVLKDIEPRIKTAEVNNLGITDKVGVGISSFKGSHSNRIKNIAHAVARLNGVLIKPDEEFSANHYAGPYTYENGYLPELVIKGREVKPEVGGGMCQIGTTLFRMAMNSGMDITQRANHSLVVNYYADPVNGNPGTDATLYEPIHDLKFKNDTGNYLLLQTDINYAKQQLTFTLWGKPDGRSGSYTHPIVSQWFGIGPPEQVVVDNLKPGQKNCQNAYRGAAASFTYTRITPSGEKIDRVFNSYYRSLPQICMVGRDPNAPPPCPEGETCAPPSLLSGEAGTPPIEELSVVR